MAFRPFSQPLRDCIVDVGALAERLVSVMVGGVVDGVYKQGDGRKLLASANVHIAQQKRMKISVAGRMQM